MHFNLITHSWSLWRGSDLQHWTEWDEKMPWAHMAIICAWLIAADCKVQSSSPSRLSSGAEKYSAVCENTEEQHIWKEWVQE